MKKNILKISLVLVLVMALFGLTMTSFAFWDNLTQKENDQTITIGEGTTITVTANLSEQDEKKSLVPSGVAMGPNDVTSYELTYNVVIDKDLAKDLKLAVTTGNLLIGGVATYASLVDVDVELSASTINIGSAVVVTITVTFDAGIEWTEKMYNAVAEKNITFDVTFTASIA